MIRYPTILHGYALQWSPFEPDKLAVATSQHYGIVGNGRLLILSIIGDVVQEIGSFDTQDGLYDVAWSEANENHLVACSGDGSIKFYDLASPENPLRCWEEHGHEIYSVNWNMCTKDRFVTGAYDAVCKVWDPNSQQSLHTYSEHSYCVYTSIWSPYRPNVFATASGDCSVKIWDCSSPKSVQTIAAHDFEVLSCDWNKYNDHEIATGSVDKSIRVWDLRNSRRPVTTLEGHTFAIRKLCYSPHSPSVIASCGYDMSVMMWDLASPDPVAATLGHHTEFVVGLDFNLFNDLIASSSWDASIAVWPTGLV